MIRMIKSIVGISLLAQSFLFVSITTAMPLNGKPCDPGEINPAAKPDPEAMVSTLKILKAALRTLSKNRDGTIIKIPIDDSDRLAPRLSRTLSRKDKVKVEALGRAIPDLKVRFNSRTGSAGSIKAGELCSTSRLSTRPAGLRARDIALDCLEDYRGLLKIDNPQEEFSVGNESTDSEGLTHLKFRQYYRGLPLWGKEVRVHLDTSQSAYLIEGRTEPTPNVNTVALVSESQALAIVENDLGNVPTSSQVEPVIHLDSLGIARLVYHIRASIGAERWQYFVDARMGIIVEKYYDTWREAMGASGIDLLGGTQTFSSWLYNSNYYMIDTGLAFHSQDPILPASTGKGNILILDLKNQSYSNYGSAYFTKSTSPTGGWDATGVTAISHFRTIANYYKNTFDRDSIDDQSRNIIGYIHVDRNYENAFWQSDVQAMFFGDGGSSFEPLVRGLDVMAHEFTHGVTQYTANLEYKFQSGALNEALSDIFACMVDRGDWRIAEDVTKISPGFLRDLSNPHQGADGVLPATMSEYRNMSINNDNGGVHINCTIPGRACYLIADGLGSGSIGRDRTEQIFYRALTLHLTRQSDFTDCREATIQSAEELYGADSAEVLAVAAGWDGVGVTSGTTDPEDEDDDPVDPVTGEDQIIFIFNKNGRLYLGMRASDGNEYYVSSVAVSPVRPIVVMDGEAALYVDTSHNLRMASLSLYNDYDQPVTQNNYVRTIGGSHDGKYFTFTSTAYDNNIYLIDMSDSSTTDTSRTFTLNWPNDAGLTSSSLKYAEVMDFDLTDTKIIFDAMSEVTLSGETEERYQIWNIGVLEIDSEKIFTLVPAQPEGTNIGNPTMGNTKEWLLALDKVDESTGTCRTMMVNLNTNESGLIIEEENSQAYGLPSFNGDDTAVAVQNQSGIVRVPLIEQSDGMLVGDPDNRQTIRALSYYPRYFRVGKVDASPVIAVSPTALTFGSMPVGSTATASLTLRNTGTAGLTLENFQMSDVQNFTHTGATSSIGAGAQKKVSVTFKPTTAGEKTATLTITSNDPVTPMVHIAITGTAVETTDEETGQEESENPQETSTDTTDSENPFDGSACFIATAAYGSDKAEDVVLLRQFRDSHLMTNGPGKAFVGFYYRHSPPIAHYIAHRSTLKAAVRIGLTPIIIAIKHPGGTLVGILLILGTGLSALRRIRTRSKRIRAGRALYTTRV